MTMPTLVARRIILSLASLRATVGKCVLPALYLQAALVTPAHAHHEAVIIASSPVVMLALYGCSVWIGKIRKRQK